VDLVDVDCWNTGLSDQWIIEKILSIFSRFEVAYLRKIKSWSAIMSKSLLKRIEINPKVMLGKPVISGTRITVEIILKKLSKNLSFEEILEDYPRLTREDIQAAIAYAATALSTDEVLPLMESTQA
jgi:uncharacterized protein (DUF433 family)